MSQTAKLFLFLGSINAFAAIALGAFGAHLFKPRLSPEMTAVYQTGIQYHLFHALGLLVVGLIAMPLPVSWYLRASGWLMFAGIILFSGSLYILSLSGIRWFGAITPVGGMAFLAAWALLAAGILKR